VRLKVELTRGVDNQPVEGFIVKLAQNHVDDFVNLWLNQLRVVKADDKFWDWLFKLGFIDRNSEYEGYALEAECGFNNNFCIVIRKLCLFSCS
jgi:hypothetical protein